MLARFCVAEEKMKAVSKKRKIERLCYLCGKPGANTTEHIPPRGLFPKEPTGKLITVPAHCGCNHRFHEDDELVRNLIIAGSTRTPHGRSAWKEQVVASWRKNPRAKRDLQERLTSVWVKDSLSGTLLRAPAMKQDISLFERQIDRWTRGLFYNKFKEPMPPNMRVEVGKLNPPEQSLIPFLEELARDRIQPIWVHVEPNVFTYTYLTTFESKHIGLAIFVFFNTEVYIGTTGMD